MAGKPKGTPAGEGYISIFPFLGDFHTRLKRALNSIKVEKKVDVVFDRKQLKEEVQELKSNLKLYEKAVDFEVAVGLNTDSVIKELSALENLDPEINARVVVDDSEFETLINGIELSEPEITATLSVDTDLAEAEMQEFHRRWERDPIYQNVVLNSSDFNGANAWRQQASRAGFGAGLAAGAAFQSGMGSIKWDVLEFMPSLVSTMHEQFDKGMRQIYNPYFRVVEKGLNRIGRQVKGVSNYFKQFDSFADMFGRMSENASKLSLRMRIMAEHAAASAVAIGHMTKAFQAASRVAKAFSALNIGKRAREDIFSLTKVTETLGKAWNATLLQAFARAPFVYDSVYRSLVRMRSEMGNVGFLSRKVSSGIAHDAQLMARRVGNSRAFVGMRRGLERMGVVSRRVGRVISRHLSSAFTRLARSARVFSFAGKALSRMGAYAAGFARIGIGAFAKVSSVLVGSLVPAIGSAVVGIGVLGGQALIGGIIALGGALLSVAQGALLVAPALIGVAGLSFGALKIGLDGVKTAVKSAFSAKTPQEFEDAIKDLHPAVQGVAREMRQFKPILDGLKSDIQSNLLDGLGPKISSAMVNLLPAVGAGLKGLATQWNQSLSLAFEELSSGRAAAGMETISRNAVLMGAEMRTVLRDLLGGFGSLAEQGSKHLIGLGQWFAEKARDFFAWAENLKKIDPSTGLSRFDTLMERAKTNAAALGKIFSNLGGIIGNVFNAGATAGGGLLGGLGDALERINKETQEGTEGFAKIQQFLSNASDAAKAFGDVIAPALQNALTIGSILANIGEGAAPGIAKFAEGLLQGLEPILGVAESFGQKIGDGVGAFDKFVANLGAGFAPVLDGLGTGIFEILSSVGSVLGSLNLQGLGEALKPLLETVGGALGNIITALQPVLDSTINTLISMAPVFQSVFSVIGDVFTAVINVLTPLFTGHDSAIQGLMDVLKPLVDVLGRALVDAIKAAQPLFDGLSQAFSIIVEAIKPLIPYLSLVIDRIGVALKDAFELITPVIPVVVGLIKEICEALGVLLVAAFEILLSVWDAVYPVLKRGFEILFNYVIIPVIKSAVAIIKTLSDVITWAFEKIIIPVIQLLGAAWEKLGQGISWVIDHWVKPALNFFSDLFTKAVDGVKSIWNGLKKVFSEPIKFFVDVVVNKGIIGAWNWIDEKIGGLGKLDVQKLPPEMAYAKGGVLPGYTPGRDPHHFYSPTGGRLHMSGGEAIMVPEWTRAMGGPRAIEKMNRDARSGRLGRGDFHTCAISGNCNHAHHNGGIFTAPQAFARGGTFRSGEGPIVDAMTRIVKEAYPMLTMTSGRIGRSGGNHGAGRAADFSNGTGNTPQQLALARDIAKTYPGSLELIYDSPGWSGNIKNGSNVGPFGAFYTMAQAGPHHNHVHWAMPSPPSLPLGGTEVFELPPGEGGGFFASAFNFMRHAFSTFFETVILNPIKALIPDSVGSFVKPLSEGLMTKGLDAVKKWALEKIGFSNEDPYTGPVGAGVEKWRDLVIHVLKAKGFQESLADTVLRRMNQESSGDPRSINTWDSNAAQGWPTKGLMQMRDDTFLSNADPGYNKNIWDPESNIRSSMNYAVRQYGSLSAAYNRHGGYDEGGEATGRGWMLKNVISPERTLSPIQTKAFNSFVYGFLPELIESYKKNPFTMQEGFDRVVNELKRTRKQMWEDRADNIENMATVMARRFRDREEGKVVLSEVSEDNLKKAIVGAQKPLIDPWAYLAAEEVAKKKVEAQKEKEREEAEKKRKDDEFQAREEKRDAKKEQREKEKEAKKKEREARRKALQASGLSKEEVKKREEAIKKEEEAEKEAEAKAKRLADHEKKQEEAEAKKLESERKKAEDAEIQRQKETGEYYYGVPVYKADGSNPNEHKDTDEEKAAKDAFAKVGDRAGFGDLAGIALNYVGTGQSLASSIQTAIPAWELAARGDTDALYHNIAATQAATINNLRSEVVSIAPSALADIADAIAASVATRDAPIIGTINSGLSQQELSQTISYAQARASRQRGGTMRVR